MGWCELMEENKEENTQKCDAESKIIFKCTIQRDFSMFGLNGCVSPRKLLSVGLLCGGGGVTLIMELMWHDVPDLMELVKLGVFEDNTARILQAQSVKRWFR